MTAEPQRIKLSLIKALAHRQAQSHWALLQVAFDSYFQRDLGQILTTEEEVPKYLSWFLAGKKGMKNAGILTKGTARTDKLRRILMHQVM